MAKWVTHQAAGTPRRFPLAQILPLTGNSCRPAPSAPHLSALTTTCFLAAPHRVGVSAVMAPRTSPATALCRGQRSC